MLGMNDKVVKESQRQVTGCQQVREAESPSKEALKRLPCLTLYPRFLNQMSNFRTPMSWWLKILTMSYWLELDSETDPSCLVLWVKTQQGLSFESYFIYCFLILMFCSLAAGWAGWCWLEWYLNCKIKICLVPSLNIQWERTDFNIQL